MRPRHPTHLRPILGVKGGVGFSRDLWRDISPQPRCACPERPQLTARAPPTWWRGWRRRMRLTGAGGRPPRPHPCPRRCGSGARSRPSETASSLPGPSGSPSGPGESLSVNWGSRASNHGGLHPGQAPTRCQDSGRPPPLPRPAPWTWALIVPGDPPGKGEQGPRESDLRACHRPHPSRKAVATTGPYQGPWGPRSCPGPSGGRSILSSTPEQLSAH